ncbi:hypothetical protein BDR04DRAFT_659515 [Suillus decipiens]|nr:hypothetical protein BDR04DRAFT_659515 [Suillus decipiens]
MHECKSLSMGIPTRSKMSSGCISALVQELQACRLHDSKYITLDEQVAIFLQLVMGAT